MDLDKVYTYPEKLKKKYFHMCRTGENYFSIRKQNPAPRPGLPWRQEETAYTEWRKNARFHYIKPFYLAEDENYQEFVSLIQEYFKEYGIFIARTTIEECW